MHTSAFIRRHINNLKDNKPFSIRDFLSYGSRTAIDQVFHRMVKSGEIIRVARGIFIKDTAIRPTVTEIAITKAAAFGRGIAVHGSEAAQQLKLIDKNNQKYIYACNGHSSSFLCGDARIYLKGTGTRKMFLGDDQVGLAVRALWYLGRKHCNRYIASQAVSQFNRLHRQRLQCSGHIIPTWMYDLITFMPK